MPLPVSPAQLRRLRARAEANKRGAPPRGRGIEPPRSVEVRYYRALRGIVRKLRGQVNRKILPLLKELEPEYFADSPGSAAFILTGAVTRLEQTPVILEQTQAKIAARMANSVEVFNRNAFIEDIRRVAGVSMRDVIKKEGVAFEIEGAIEDNVGLIKSIPEQYHQRLIKAINDGIEQGDDYFSIRRKILEIGQSTEKRARFIARDQTAKLHSAVTRTRQTNLGITHYFWRTSQDERVRPSHEAKEGNRYAWSDPPADTGHPGEDFNCRCSAEPDLTPVLEQLDVAA